MRCYSYSEIITGNLSLGIAQYTQQHPENIHIHDFSEIVYIVSGRVVHYVNGESYLMYPGDMLVITPGNTHSFSPLERITYIDIYDAKKDDYYSDTRSAVMHFDGPVRGSLENVLNCMYREYKSKDKFYDSILTDYFSIFTKIVRRQESRDIGNDFVFGSSDALKSRLDRILERVETAPEKSPKLSEIAEELHYTVPYLSKKFVCYYGSSYTQYVYKKKYEKAVEQLISTDHSVAEIADRCGLTDITHFYQTFRDQYHMTPVAFRKQYSSKS